MKIFWLILIASCLVWYILATGIVAVGGFKNIRSLLKQNKD